MNEYLVTVPLTLTIRVHADTERDADETADDAARAFLDKYIREDNSDVEDWDFDGGENEVEIQDPIDYGPDWDADQYYHDKYGDPI